KEKLPGYMVPASFVFLESLPLTAHGKVDRRALPASDTLRSELEESLAAPRTPVEEVIAGVWVQLLGIQRVTIHANFFDLGRDSLLATQLISRLRGHFQVELPLRSLFDSPTIAGLAEAIESAKSRSAAHRIPDIVPVSRELYRANIQGNALKSTEMH